MNGPPIGEVEMSEQEVKSTCELLPFYCEAMYIMMERGEKDLMQLTESELKVIERQLGAAYVPPWKSSHVLVMDGEQKPE